MPTLGERYAEWQASKANPPQENSETPTATATGGDVASSYQRFVAKHEAPDLAAQYKAARGGTFQRSLDADTVDLSRGKIRQATRLAGIDAPESGQALGPGAQAYLDGLVGEERDIKVGSKTKDKYGRDVSILYAGGKNLSLELVKAGQAKVAYQEGLSTKLQKEMLEAQDAARKAGKGVWAADYVEEDPQAYRKRMGHENMAKGHDMRKAIDEDTLTLSQHFRKFKGLPEVSVAQKVQPYFDKFREDRDQYAREKQGIKRADQYQEPGSWLERVSGALDYLGNISRSGLKGVIEGDGVAGKIDLATKYAAQAGLKERSTTGTNLRDTATEHLGLGKLRMGVDDGKFSVGDLGDFALDLGTEVFTDPLSAISSVASGLVRGTGLAGKVAPKLAKAAAEAGAGLRTPEALKYIAGKRAVSGAIGAAYGVGVTDDDASLATKLAAAGAGAVIGAGAPAALDRVGGVFRRGADAASNWYAKTTRGSRFENFAVARKVAVEAFDKIKNMSEWIRQGRYDALDGLDTAQRVRATSIMTAAKSETLRRRAVLEANITGVKGTADYNRQFNAMMRKINYDVETSWLPAVLNKEEDLVAGAVAKWADHNEKVVTKLNREVFGLEKADDSTRNVGVLRKDGSFVKDPRNGRLMREQHFKESVLEKLYPDDPKAFEKFEKDYGAVEKRQYGEFASKDISIKPKAALDHSYDRWRKKERLAPDDRYVKEIKQGEKLTSFDMKQTQGAGERPQYARRTLQEDTHLNPTDVDVRQKDFQPHDPKTFRGGKGIVGLKYHTDDVYELHDVAKRVKEAEDLMEGFQIYKAESLERSGAAEAMAAKTYQEEFGKAFTGAAEEKGAYERHLVDARNKTYGIYAEQLAKAFLNDEDRKAVKLMKEYGETAAKQAPVRALETVLDGFDKVSNVMKAQMLYFSTSWIKNNMFDNVAKAWVENGLHGLVDTATMGKFQKGVFEDVRDIYAGKMNRKYGSPDFQDALKRGVLDNPMFKALHDETTRSFLYRPEALAEKLGKEGLAKKMARAISRNPFNDKVASLGSHMEGTARMVCYQRAKEALLQSPRFKNATPAQMAEVKNIAAELVKKTFFDYSDVTHFEKAVFGRMIPFYSFYSKNLPYWIKATLDPEKMGRVAALDKVRRNIGSQPTKFEEEGMTPYLRDAAPRRLGVGADGETTYGVVPSGSLYDAFKMLNPKDMAAQLIEKGHPIPKAVYELISGNDLFDGQKLYPSASEQHKKFLFSRGYKYRALGIPGVELDEKGNPYATSDFVVGADKVLSTLLPHGAIDQVAGSVGKLQHGKEGLSEAIVNRLSPVQMVKVSAAYARMVRQQKAKERD